MLGGDGEPLLKCERQTLIGIDKFARDIRFAVDIRGARVWVDDQVERTFRRFETVLRQETGDIARRHRCETGHAVDAGSCDQGFRRHQLARRHEQDIRTEIAVFERADERAGKRAECLRAHIGHIRVAERDNTVELLKCFL